MRFLTINFYTSKEVNLWKDNGGIPFALSKYYGYESRYVYLNKHGITTNSLYEKYAEIDSIDSGNSNIINYFNILKYIYKNIKYYDVYNFYELGIIGILSIFVARIKNPEIIIYNKLDMGKSIFRELTQNKSLVRKLKNYILAKLTKNIDLYTVETKMYVNALNNLERFNGRIKYLPNGYFSDLVEIDKNIKKEKIILTVGRLGSPKKNTEMLVSAIKNIEPEKLKGWKVYLVGPMTEEFKKWFDKEIENKPYLQELFVITGNISDKKELYTLYARSSVFVLSSRFEGSPLVVPEALYFACYPIITNCYDAVYEVINDSNNGFGKIIENENAISLQSAIEEVLNGNIDYLDKGCQASKFVQKNFDWRFIVAQLDKYIKEMSENRLYVKRN